MSFCFRLSPTCSIFQKKTKRRWSEHKSTALTAFGERQVISVDAVASFCLFVFVFKGSPSPDASLIPGVALMKGEGSVPLIWFQGIYGCQGGARTQLK